MAQLPRLKNRMVSLLSAGVVLLAVVAAFPLAVHAQGINQICNNATAANSTFCQEAKKGDTVTGPNGILTKATNIVAFIVGIAAVFMIAFAGFTYITSSGDSSKVTEAKNILIYAIVGLVIAILARSIILYILSRIQ